MRLTWLAVQISCRDSLFECIKESSLALVGNNSRAEHNVKKVQLLRSHYSKKQYRIHTSGNFSKRGNEVELPVAHQ